MSVHWTGLFSVAAGAAAALAGAPCGLVSLLSLFCDACLAFICLRWLCCVAGVGLGVEDRAWRRRRNRESGKGAFGGHSSSLNDA
ncbi:hypothetical protein TGAM01_v206174 [Trichoderma gamsii]|uniref:Uncharacterized protein n=1 Tax=Trichoderma gamsii TaxID=398673 RepID=A0A2P4ZLB5_9HYPO|nr:hypothetical protein TGAM01_v206174 [Trichoderma gamsii]PON25093.1 hypothetical protein TGAM01_v206174 [Trichoderma gamsii]